MFDIYNYLMFDKYHLLSDLFEVLFYFQKRSIGNIYFSIVFNNSIFNVGKF